MGKGYYFFETPDYDNCAGKVWWAAKAGAIPSIGLYGFETIMGQPRTMEMNMIRFYRVMFPFTASCALAASSTCLLANLRGKKDGCSNYFFGGATTGILWSAYLKSSGRGAVCGFLFASFFAMMKKAHIEDWVIFPSFIPGNTTVAGSYGGENWGNMTITKLSHDDPGRRPIP
ncbi:hypothetical protein HDE_13425 [Halotydeus destructor]|nr:hypothetical protein HDE_13425 [Halotydeus destructor]